MYEKARLQTPNLSSSRSDIFPTYQFKKPTQHPALTSQRLTANYLITRWQSENITSINIVGTY